MPKKAYENEQWQSVARQARPSDQLHKLEVLEALRQPTRRNEVGKCQLGYVERQPSATVHTQQEQNQNINVDILKGSLQPQSRPNCGLRAIDMFSKDHSYKKAFG